MYVLVEGVWYSAGILLEQYNKNIVCAIGITFNILVIIVGYVTQLVVIVPMYD
jgi:hypothetical protein